MAGLERDTFHPSQQSPCQLCYPNLFVGITVTTSQFQMKPVIYCLGWGWRPAHIIKRSFKQVVKNEVNMNVTNCWYSVGKLSSLQLQKTKRKYHKSVKCHRCLAIVGGEEHCYLEKRYIYIIFWSLPRLVQISGDTLEYMLAEGDICTKIKEFANVK